MDDSFKNLIDTAKSVLILLPTNADFDTVAAGLSLYLAISDKANIASPTPMRVEFNRLVGVNKISSDIGTKNLTIKFINYKADGIEKVSYDVQNGMFGLTVVPKNGLQAPTKDQIELSYGGISAEAVILVGGANENHFPDVVKEDIKDAKLIHLGTSELRLPNKNPISFARPASSVSEVVYSLMKQSNLTVDSDIATNLLMGLEEGSDNFGGQGVNAETFSTAAELMQTGGRRVPKDAPKPRDFPAGSIPRQPVRTLGDRQQSQSPAPKSWLENPKIYKGTSVS